MEINIFFSFLIELIGLILISSFNVHAQYKYSISAGVSHERQFESTGSHIRMYYHLHEHVRFHAGYTYFLEVTHNEGNQTVSNELRSLNLNFNYVILIGKRLGFYPILGFNYSYGSETIQDDVSKFEDFNETLGINAGFGFGYQMGRFMPYIESNSIMNNIYYLVFKAGLAVSLGKTKKETPPS